MYELEGGADFRNLSFHFLMRSLNLYAGDAVKIKPGQSKMVPLCIDTHAMERSSQLRERKLLDIDLYKVENEKVIINLKTERKDKLVQTLPALMSKGTIFLSAVNNTDVVWKIEKSQMMGSLDCRSLGYFHISRNSLQRVMLDKADFLTDRETVEYFNILKEDHKNVMKFAQEAVLKKQQEMDTKRNTKLGDRKSKGKEDYNDNVNIPDRVIKPIAHRVPNINMGNLQIPPVLNEPIPMKPVKKATPVIDYDQILAPVNIDVTLNGQLPPFDMEKGFEAIHTTAEQLPDLESLFG